MDPRAWQGQQPFRFDLDAGLPLALQPPMRKHSSPLRHFASAFGRDRAVSV